MMNARPTGLLAACLAAALLACSSDPGAATKEDLDQRLANQRAIFHFGCNEVHACGRDRRVCDAARLRDELAAHRPVAVEYETIDGGYVGRQHIYYFIEADGRGTKFYELATDVLGGDCGSYCGWHSVAFSRFTFATGEGRVTLESDDGRFGNYHGYDGFFPDVPADPRCRRP